MQPRKAAVAVVAVVAAVFVWSCTRRPQLEKCRQRILKRQKTHKKNIELSHNSRAG